MSYSPSTIYQPLATKRSAKLLLSALTVFSFFAVFIAASAPASAANGADFQAGRIIDDVVFTNKDSMSVAQIQAFLDSKVPVCDRWRPSSNPNYQPPWTCLKEYQENPTTGDNNIGPAGRGPNGEPRQVPGGISAAQIIWNAAQAYNISPQVILVTLQKEQSLVTDDWPWSIQYFRAMGANCPDGPGGAQCNPNFAGFLKQIDGGTWQFRHDFNGIGTSGFWAPYARGWNNILYQDPNTTAGCGTKQVFIENQATAVLYKYTPYTPNQAALNNLYGTGDACSAYGNRNFWRLFTDWFGTTYAPNFSAHYLDVQNYTDSTKTVGIPANALNPGQRTYMVLRFTNTGNTSWSNTGPGATRLATLNYQVSPFCDTSTWIACDRPAPLKEAVVAPGAVGTFEFWYKAPAVSSDVSFSTQFGVISEGVAQMQGVRQIQATIVYSPRYISSYQSVQNYTDTTKTVSTPANILNPGQRTFMILTFKNVGNITWRNNGPGAVRAAVLNNVTAFCDETWLSCLRPASMKETTVNPGELATFEFWYKAPMITRPTQAVTNFGVVAEAISLMSSSTQQQTTQVPSVQFTADYTDVQNYTDETKTQSIPANILRPGDRTYMVLRFRNTSNFEWRNTGWGVIRLSTLNTSSNPFCDATWITCNRPTQMKEAVVAPGDFATFEFWYKAPNVSTDTTVTTQFGLVSDFLATLSGNRQIQTTLIDL